MKSDVLRGTELHAGRQTWLIVAAALALASLAGWQFTRDVRTGMRNGPREARC